MKHVMVVDDERDILTCMYETLSKEGYRVTAAISGAEALETIAHETPDLLVLDLRMPQISGIEVLQDVRRKHPDLPIVVSSALHSYRNDIEILSANVAAFLDKPIDLDELVATVRNLIGPAGAPGRT